MEIVQNLWQVGGGDLTSPEDAATYLLRSGEQAALIDAGCGIGHGQLAEQRSRDIMRIRTGQRPDVFQGRTSPLNRSWDQPFYGRFVR
jgi:hypothetical protein